MTAGQVMAGGAHWCEEHGRNECTRTSKRSQSRCHDIAVLGTDACRTHAGVSLEAQRTKGEANLLVAAAGMRRPEERVHPAVVLLDACQLAYELMQQASEGQAAGMDRDAAAALWERLEGSVDRAARIAKAALDADAQDRHVRALERRAGDQAEGVESLLRSFVEGLGLSWDAPVVQGALVAALEAGPGR